MPGNDELIELKSAEELEYERIRRIQHRKLWLLSAVAVAAAVMATALTAVGGRTVWVRALGYVTGAIVFPCAMTLRFSIAARRAGLDAVGRRPTAVLLMLNLLYLAVGFYHGHYLLRRWF